MAVPVQIMCWRGKAYRSAYVHLPALPAYEMFTDKWPAKFKHDYRRIGIFRA
jgi:hypothetical protein